MSRSLGSEERPPGIKLREGVFSLGHFQRTGTPSACVLWRYGVSHFLTTPRRFPVVKTCGNQDWSVDYRMKLPVYIPISMGFPPRRLLKRRTEGCFYKKLPFRGSIVVDKNCRTRVEGQSEKLKFQVR